MKAVRVVLPQYRVATDDFLVQKFEKRLHLASEELCILLESAGAKLNNDMVTTTLMTKCLESLAVFMKKELHISVTPKSLIDCISLTASALERQYPVSSKWGTLLWDLIPNYTSNTSYQLTHR